MKPTTLVYNWTVGLLENKTVTMQVKTLVIRRRSRRSSSRLAMWSKNGKTVTRLHDGAEKKMPKRKKHKVQPIHSAKLKQRPKKKKIMVTRQNWICILLEIWRELFQLHQLFILYPIKIDKDTGQGQK